MEKVYCKDCLCWNRIGNSLNGTCHRLPVTKMDSFPISKGTTFCFDGIKDNTIKLLVEEEEIYETKI